MERIRPFLMITLIFLGLLLWQAWQDRYQQSTNTTEINKIDSDNSPILSSDEVDVPIPPKTVTENVVSNLKESESPEIKYLETEVFKLGINPRGGKITELLLKNYPISLKTPFDYVEMLNDSVLTYFAYQNGLAGNKSLPNHNSLYKFEGINKKNVQNGNGPSLDIVFSHTENDIRVIKTYQLQADSYLINIEYLVENKSNKAIAVYNYEQLKRKTMSSRNGLIYTYAGAVFSTPNKRFEKYDFDDLLDKPIKEKSQNSWIGNMQHYFAAALIPPIDSVFNFYSKTHTDTNEYTVGFVSDGNSLQPNESLKLSSAVYIGPKIRVVDL